MNHPFAKYVQGNANEQGTGTGEKLPEGETQKDLFFIRPDFFGNANSNHCLAPF
jgi:hypothetical protein